MKFHIQFSSSNILVTLTEPNYVLGETKYKKANNLEKVISQISAGSLGFRNSRKRQPVVLQSLVAELAKFSPSALEIETKGFNRNRDSFLKLLIQKFNVLKIVDKTPLAFNGCRRPARRRL